jgi:hypothetical protein
MDPYSVTPAKALEQIGKKLEDQYQRCVCSQMVRKVRLRPSRGCDETVHGFPCGE